MRIVFIGTGDIGLPTLRGLQVSDHELVGVLTQPDKPAGRDQKKEAPPIKKAVTGENVPILQPERIKDRKAIEEIRALVPQVIIVMAYGQILPVDVLHIPTIACLNLHASLLPRWRGAAPVQAAIAAGDHEGGLTIMYMDEGLDTGDILLQRKITLAPDETGSSLHDRLAAMAPDTILESLRLIESGNAPKTPQNSALATYAPKLTRENGRIDWNQSAEIIERKIRAYNPWPGAFTSINGRNLKIFRAAIIEQSGPSGQILRSDNELIIAAADRALSLEEVQLEGRRRMLAPEFLRGHALTS